MKTTRLWVALPLLAAAGCGGASVPAGKLTDTRSAIRAAEEVGAPTHANASIHLRLAKDSLAHAERALRDDEATRASLLLSQAQVDADLALALSRQSEEVAAAEHARAQIRMLQAERQPTVIPRERE